jgi:hypothetical protein
MGRLMRKVTNRKALMKALGNCPYKEAVIRAMLVGQEGTGPIWLNPHVACEMVFVVGEELSRRREGLGALALDGQRNISLNCHVDPHFELALLLCTGAVPKPCLN